MPRPVLAGGVGSFTTLIGFTHRQSKGGVHDEEVLFTTEFLDRISGSEKAQIYLFRFLPDHPDGPRRDWNTCVGSGGHQPGGIHPVVGG